MLQPWEDETGAKGVFCLLPLSAVRAHGMHMDPPLNREKKKVQLNLIGSLPHQPSSSSLVPRVQAVPGC